jgi:cytochrome o ubiquinol oxidase operon protein cyoD
MSEHRRAIVGHHDSSTRGTLASYVTGYIFSIYLTITAWLLVRNHLLQKTPLLILIILLALAQFMVQIFFFLHLGRERKPRWRLIVFFGMVAIVLILVIGSLWIMTTLRYRMTIPQMENYMNQQQGL